MQAVTAVQTCALVFPKYVCIHTWTPRFFPQAKISQELSITNITINYCITTALCGSLTPLPTSAGGLLSPSCRGQLRQQYCSVFRDCVCVYVCLDERFSDLWAPCPKDACTLRMAVCPGMHTCQSLLINDDCAVQSMCVVKHTKRVLTHFLELSLNVTQRYVEKSRADSGFQSSIRCLFSCQIKYLFFFLLLIHFTLTWSYDQWAGTGLF